MICFDIDIGKYGDIGCSEFDVVDVVFVGEVDVVVIGSFMWVVMGVVELMGELLIEVWCIDGYCYCMFIVLDMLFVERY